MSTIPNEGGGGGHIIQEEGSSLTARAKLNFKGAGITAADNAGTGATDVTVSGGAGTVTDMSIVTANGISGTVATSTTTPAVTLALGAITPSTVNAVTISGTSTPTLAVTGTTAVSGTNTGDNATNSQYSGLVSNATHTGDATGSGALTVVALNGTNLAGLATGVLKNTATTGVPFISKVTVTEPATAATLTIVDGATLTASATASVSGTNTGDNAANTSIAATKLDDFATPDDNTDLNANTTNHGLLLKATAPAAGLLNFVGIGNGETAYTNKALFDATGPSTQAFGDSAAVGTAAVAARRDHKHEMMAAPTTVSGSAGSLKSNATTGVMQIVGPAAGETRVMTVPDANSTLIVSGGALGTPASGTLTNCTFPTLNQNTSGTAANLSGTPALPNGTTATTQSASDNSTKIATTAYADAAAAGGVSQAQLNVTNDNVALLGFRLASSSSLSVQKMEDGIIDEYEDQTGVDTVNSVVTYDSTSDYYTNQTAGQTGSGTALSGGNASGTAMQQSTANDQWGICEGSSLDGAGQSFIASSSFSMSGFTLSMKRYYTTSLGIRAYLYAADSNDYPTGSALAESATFEILDLGTTFASQTFTFATPYSVTSGSKYVALIKYYSGTMSANTQIAGQCNQSAAWESGKWIRSASGTTWTVFAEGRSLTITLLYSTSPASAFDASTSTFWGSSQTTTSVSGTAYIGYDFGSGVTKALNGFSIKQHAAAQGITSVKVQRSDNNSSWTDVATQAIAADTTVQTFQFSNSTAARYWRLLANANTTSGSWEIEEVTLTIATNLSLISTSFEAEGTPTSGRVVVFSQDVDTLTVNTDIKAYVSRTDGASYAEVTLVDEGDYDASGRILSGTVDVSAQTSDKTMRYKVVTANNKTVKIHGTSLSWK